MEEKFMKLALKQAQKAEKIGEIPVGCVIVQDGRVISRGYNMRETKKNALLHAEIIAINKAAKRLGGWRLPNCDIYVTLEPCPMCTGAIINARIDNVYFGAYDKKTGCLGSLWDLTEKFPHKLKIMGGILKDECEDILKNFFKTLRKRDK